MCPGPSTAIELVPGLCEGCWDRGRGGGIEVGDGDSRCTSGFMLRESSPGKGSLERG